MAMTHDYLEFLDERIGISPTNSEEELKAAEVISDLMGQHDVEASVEEFDAPLVAGLTPALLAVACLLGMILVGTGVLPLTLIGLILAVAPAVLSVLRLFGRAPQLSFGPRAQSQNVVAVHRASGPLVTKGSRTIVIAAHYDSPRENFLYTSPVAPYLPLLNRLAVPCSFAVAVCALIQLLGFLPAPFRIIVWIVGILAALPAMVPAVGAIAERTAPCTDGANDNKAAVAALLGILENVRPSGVEPKARPVVVPEEASEETPDQDDEVPVPVDGEALAEPGFVFGVRHGERVLRELSILPESCDIEYVAPVRPAAPVVAEAPAPEPEPAAEPDDVTLVEPAPEPVDAPAVTSETAPLAIDAEKTVETVALGTADASAATTREDLLATGRFEIVMDDESRGVGPKDTSGLSAMDDDFDPDATQPAPPVRRPDAPSDPEWGKTSYRPQLTNVARRASLFDLPDPSGRETDPFATNPNGQRVPAQGAQGADQQRLEVMAGGSQAEPLETIGPQDQAAEEEAEAPGEKPKNIVLSLINRLRGKAAATDEPDDESDGEDGGNWRGGAATRSGLRLVDDESPANEGVPTEEELRDAVLSLGDDELIAHDIWFVALGASSLDHAGMRSFLARHRSEIRGCFVVNLDCIGAGRLVTLKNEGREETRRADRRMTRLLGGAASDLHVELGQETHDWADTDATPAMRSSLRAVTLMGLDDNGLPALSGTPDDVTENVSGDQAAQVAALVTEMIRRS